MKRRIVRDLNYFHSYRSTFHHGSNIVSRYIPGNVTAENYRTVQAYLFKLGLKYPIRGCKCMRRISYETKDSERIKLLYSKGTNGN